jgi:hypothetical protein
MAGHKADKMVIIKEMNSIEYGLDFKSFVSIGLVETK